MTHPFCEYYCFPLQASHSPVQVYLIALKEEPIQLVSQRITHGLANAAAESSIDSQGVPLELTLWRYLHRNFLGFVNMRFALDITRHVSTADCTACTLRIATVIGTRLLHHAKRWFRATALKRKHAQTLRHGRFN